MTDATVLWYFAYGSNVDPETFLGRRRMRPSDARRAALPGWELVFDLPVGPGERGVANLRAAPREVVHGVAWAIDARQAEHLDRTEGVPQGFYARRDVTLDSDGGSLDAFAYVSSLGRPGRRPSRRYLGLLLRGARHHALPDAWIARLRSLPLAVDERETAQRELDL